MADAAARFDERALDIRRRAACVDTQELDIEHLVRLGTLAASSHNAQPWKFTIGDSALRILPDFTRRCPVVDPDDRHLFKSLGCAVENVVLGAAAQGHDAQVRFDKATNAIDIAFAPAPDLEAGDLCEAIPCRQCSRVAFDGMPLADSELEALEKAGSRPGVRVQLFTTTSERNAIAGFVSRGDIAQLSDSAFRAELVRWIRFSPAEALATGDGLATRCIGQPAIARWIGQTFAGMLLRPQAQAEKDARHVRSSAGVAVFVSRRDDPAGWIEVGRSCQRFALRATRMDVRTAFLNQPIEVAALRPEFEAWLDLADGEHAHLLVRFGRGAVMPFSLRRPLASVIAQS